MPNTVTGIHKHFRVAGKVILYFIAVVILSLLLEVILVIGVCTFISLYPGATAGSSSNVMDILAPLLKSSWLTAALRVAQNTAYVLVPVFFLTVIDRQKLFQEKPVASTMIRVFRSFCTGMLFCIVLVSIYMAITVLTGISALEINGLSVYGLVAIIPSMLQFIMIALSTGIGEEMLFRRYLQDYLAGKYRIAASILIVSLIFAITHVFSQPQPLATTGIFLMSILLGYLYVIYGSVWPCIGFHFLWDFMAIGIFPMGRPYLTGSSPLYVFSQPHDILLFGLNMGSEDNLIVIALFLILIVGLYIQNRLPAFDDKTCPSKQR